MPLRTRPDLPGKINEEIRRMGEPSSAGTAHLRYLTGGCHASTLKILADEHLAQTHIEKDPLHA